MTEPISETFTDPTVAVATEAVRGVVDNAKSLGLTWSLRPGSVATDSPLTSSDVDVILDGDSAPLTTTSLLGPLLSNQRVMVMSIPPGGMYVIGSAYMDPWHEVGGDNGPAFASGWSNFGAPGGSVGYRRTIDGHLELTGLAAFSGTTSAPTTIFTLPEGWRPDRLITIMTSNNPGATTAPTPRTLQVNTAGNVYVTNFAGTVAPGLIGLDGIYFALRTGI